MSAGRLETCHRPLRIAASYGPSESIVPSLLAVMKKRRPELEVVFRTTDSWTITRLVLSSQVEIGLVNHVSRSPQLIVEPYSDEEIVAITSLQSPLARKSHLSIKEFSALPLVVRERRGRSQTGTSFHKLRKLGVLANVVMHCESFVAMKSAVEKGIGVGLLSRDHLLVEESRRSLKVLKVPELKMRLERVVIYRKGKPLSIIATEFLNLLRSQINTLIK
jgi:DNA-binding transcriptional LysR family regulator